MIDTVAAVAEPKVVGAAWAHIDRGRLLVVRPHDVDVYFLPGGLVEAGDSLAEAARAGEEVGAHLDPGALRPVVFPPHRRTGSPGERGDGRSAPSVASSSH